MQVLTVTPPDARLEGPASAMQKLGEIATANEMLGLCTLVVMSEADKQNCFVMLDVPKQITHEDARKLTPEMPVFLMGEGERPLRSENVTSQFADLCGVVNDGRLFLTSRAPAASGMRLS